MNIKEVLKTMVDGQKFTIDYVSKVSLKGGKSNEMQGRVMKLVSGLVCEYHNSYEKLVKDKMVSEGLDPMTFQSKPRKWGTKEKDYPIITHTPKGSDEIKHYLELFVEDKPSEVKYYLDGDEINKDEIIGLDTETKPVNEGSQGGLKDKVTVRTVDLKTIKKIQTDDDIFEDSFEF